VDEGLMDLPAAIRMLTVNAARAVGLRDRAAIEPGLLADLLLVRMSRSGVPSVEQVFRAGRPVFSFAEPSRTPALAAN